MHVKCVWLYICTPFSLQFFVYGKPSESIARDLLLLATAFDWEVPVRHRANTWLEIFGNSLVQERTSKYIAKKRLELIRLVCDDAASSGVGSLAGLVDLSLLKYRHRDELEAVFKSWGHTVKYDGKYVLCSAEEGPLPPSLLLHALYL
jgi:dynein assembly factor 3, axonemal